MIEILTIQKKRGKKGGLSERGNNANLGVGECVEDAVLCHYYIKKCLRRKISSLFLVFSGKKVYFCEIFLTTTANKRCQISSCIYSDYDMILYLRCKATRILRFDIS